MKGRYPDNCDDVLRYARQMGWEARRTRNGWWLTHPDGGQTSFHAHRITDWRAWRNIYARLRRTAG